VARRTNLYQAPRSPLIQGRTRWERPLWQAWLGGAVVALAVGSAFLVAASASLRGGGAAAGVFPAAAVSGIVGVLVGAGLGSLEGRLLGWRWRWVAAALLGLAGLALALVLMQLLHLPVFYGIGTG
jgi:hypothetical protein